VSPGARALEKETAESESCASSNNLYWPVIITV
jgi:hypothetical protein